MAAAWQASGTLLGSTGADISPVWPAHAIDDIGILMASSRVITETCATPGGGWALLQGPADVTAWRTYAFWKRATSASEADALLDWSAATGQKYGQIHTIRGAITTGDPFSASSLDGDITDTIVVTGIDPPLTTELVIVAGIGSDNASTSATVTGGNINLPGYTLRHFSTIITGNDATGLFYDILFTWILGRPLRHSAIDHANPGIL